MKVTKHEPVPVPAPTPIFDLIGLTEVEATVISAVMANIGGAPEETYRRHADTVYRALQKAGVDYARVQPTLSGSLTFAPVENPDVLNAKSVKSDRRRR